MKLNPVKKISIVILVVFIGMFLAAETVSPYNIWFKSRIGSVNAKSCPALWNFSTLAKVEKLPLERDGDYSKLNNILLDTKYTDMREAAIGNASLGGGVKADGFGIVTGGVITYDDKDIHHGGGDKFIGLTIGRLEFNNSKLNIVNIIAPGLAHSETYPLMVTGDQGLDTVYLDGCLSWSFPKKISQSNEVPALWQFIATDNLGETRTVEIQQGLRIKALTKSKINDWALQSNLFKPKDSIEKKNVDQSFVSEPISKSEEKLKTRILAWGTNDAGQLGNDLKAGLVITPIWATAVEKILEPDFTVTQIDGGEYTSCLLRSDKTVWCWGGGDSHDMNIAPPPVAKVEGLPSIKSLEMGSGYLNCGKSEDNKIWCWDRTGKHAQIYQYSSWNPQTDQKIDYQQLRSSFVDFYPGMSDACAITDQRKLWCWGSTYSNDGDVYRSSQKNTEIFPVEVTLAKSAITVNVGFRETCAILDDQSAWCWSNSLNPSPHALFSQGENVKQVFSGWDKGCALKEDGTVWCWGSGQSSLKQIKISDSKPLNDVIKLDNQGNTLFCALRKDNSIWCWGGRGGDPAHQDQIGDQDPVRIKGPNGICNIRNATDMAVGAWSGYALIKGDEKFFEKLDSPDRSTEILSAIQSADFDRARKLIPESACLDANSNLAGDAMASAITRQQVDLVQKLIDAGLNLEATNRQKLTPLLLATSPFNETNAEIIRALVNGGADINAKGPFGETPLSYLEGSPDKNKEAIDIILAQLQKKEGRKFYTHPPASLKIEELIGSEAGCKEGKAVFSSAGKYSLDVPLGCSKVLAKVWGAGGGGQNGGTGGFSVGIIDLANVNKMEIVVGGGGHAGTRGVVGKSGFNNGGDGGEGGVRPDYSWGSGGGGGGRSEISTNDKPVIIAGGGGGDGRAARGLPGGGRNSQGFMADYFSKIRTFSGTQEISGWPGDNGVGGAAGRKSMGGYQGCIASVAGGEKEGGLGAKALDGQACGAAGGGGGGSGYGGGGGGGPDDGGSGGGGGGYTPQAGLTLWGGLLSPANAEDPDYISPNGQSQKDGLIVVSWPAPPSGQLIAKLNEFSPYQAESTIKDTVLNPNSDAHVQVMPENSVGKQEAPSQQSPISDSDAKPYDNFADIPQVLKTGMWANVPQQQYIDRIKDLIKRASDGKGLVDQSLIVEKQSEALKNAQKQQLSSLLNYDDNLDGNVALEEGKAYINKKFMNIDNRQNALLQRYTEQFARLDKNKDGVLTHDEMISLDPDMEQRVKDNIVRSYQTYLDLDPNKDGTLTSDELELLAKRAFATVDRDKNGILSQEEIFAINQTNRAAMPQFEQGIGNAGDPESQKIVQTVARIKSIDAATTTFRDMYNALPGDMTHAETRIPKCAKDCGSGDGNGRIGTNALKQIELFKDERHLFWVHLRRVELLNGYSADSHISEWGQAFPAAPIGGGFQVYSYDGSGHLPGTFEGSQAQPGLYLILTNDVLGDFSSKNSHFLTPTQAARIDMKLDDGLPLTGAVIAAGDKECLENANSTLGYKRGDIKNEKGCLSLYIRIQSYDNTQRSVPQQKTEQYQSRGFINSAQITQYPASVRTSLVRMIIGGMDAKGIYFDDPATINCVKDTTGRCNKKEMQPFVFDPSGGGASYQSAPAELFANGKQGPWIFSSGWKIDKIGTTGNTPDSNEIIAFLPNIGREFCKKINGQLGIFPKNGDDVDNDGIPRGGKNDILPTPSYGMTRNNPGINKEVNIIDAPSFAGQPFGCYDLSDGNGVAGDGPYVYYHVLIER